MPAAFPVSFGGGFTIDSLFGAFSGFNSLLSGTSTIVGGIFQGRAAELQAQFQAQQLEFNSRLAELQAEEAILLGEEQASDIKSAAKQIQGAQRAAFASQGVDVGFGSAAEVQADTTTQSTIDAIRVRNNALKQAFGYRLSALGGFQQSAFAQVAGRNVKAQTILGAGINAIPYDTAAALIGLRD
jgi:hypothetical protein